MKKFLSILAVASTAMYFTSCSKSDVTDVGDEKAQQPMEIKVGGKALSITPGKTRAPFEGIAVGNSLTARVLASNTSKKYDAIPDLIKDGTMTFDHQAPTPPAVPTAFGFDGGAVPYPHATNDVFLVGLYPTAPSADWTITDSGSKAKYTFNGSHDVMAADEVTTVRSDGTTGTYKTLNFHHLLTRLNLTVEAEDQPAKDAWGKVTSVKVKSPANDVTVTFKTESATIPPTTTFGSTETDFPFYMAGSDNALTSLELPLESTTPTAQSYSIVATKNGNAVSYDLIVTTEKFTAGYNINIPLMTADATPAAFDGDTRGLQFNIKLTFRATDIKAFATVKEWGTGGTGGATIQ